MNKVLDFIENHKFGIVITLIAHVALFIYFQIDTYTEPVTYDTFSYRTKDKEAPDDIEITPEQIQTPQEAALLKESEPVSSLVKSANDQREESNDKNIKYTSYSGDPAESVKEYESKILQELNAGKTQKESDDGKTDLEVGKQNENKTENKSSGQAASEKKKAGKTMVEYDLVNRHPLNRNDWHVRNPGYTCGNVNGVVTVKIRVAQSGNVIDADYMPERSLNADACMIEKAEEYALLSRFNYDGTAGKYQEGTITYRFVYR
ncbi:MAG: hypothetical protein R3277_03605 [Brumimicrobium sp.]|nr:hypothetical protein [Brumimicrobium sp.]